MEISCRESGSMRRMALMSIPCRMERILPSEVEMHSIVDDDESSFEGICSPMRSCQCWGSIYPKNSGMLKVRVVQRKDACGFGVRGKLSAHPSMSH